MLEAGAGPARQAVPIEGRFQPFKRKDAIIWPLPIARSANSFSAYRLDGEGALNEPL